MLHAAIRKSIRTLLPVGAVMLVQPAFVHADVAVDWGYNANGQIGNGASGFGSPANTQASPYFVALPSTISAVAAGGAFTIAIDATGSYSGWGDNTYGQTGNGSTAGGNVVTPATTTYAPVISAVASGSDHTLFVQGGAVYAFGRNRRGQLGVDTATASSPTPIASTVLTSGVTAVAAGSTFSVAIQNGALFTWGNGQNGKLGDGTTTTLASPTPLVVTGFETGVTAIAAGSDNGFAVKGGQLYGWGLNSSGSLGVGTTTVTATPTAVAGFNSGITSIAGGGTHSLLVKDGNVYATGNNTYGQLGNGTTTNSSTFSLVDGLSNITQVAASNLSSYALASDGSLWVWGLNQFGSLGIGNATTTTYTTPQHLFAPSGYKFATIDADGSGNHAVATFVAVPEPATLAVLGGAGLLALRRRRA